MSYGGEEERFNAEYAYAHMEDARKAFNSADCLVDNLKHLARETLDEADARYVTDVLADLMTDTWLGALRDAEEAAEEEGIKL